jgi:hypothetical protein
MLDPRIYRASLIVVALGVFVLAFSLTSQQGPLGTTLAPDAFNGQNAYSTMVSLANQYPNRRPGSTGDNDVATYVASRLQHYGFSVSTRSDRASTADGRRTLETVIGTRAGLSSGSILVVAHRDALGSPATADLSGTAVLIELARVLSGETQHRSVILASTSGSDGVAGATRLARSLPGKVDAVIALGDLASKKVREPIVVPWSNGTQVAPTMLRNTVAAALRSQALLKPGGTSLAGQLAHLALPLTLSEQGPFGARGVPAVLVSLSGERAPAAGEQIGDPDRIGGMGRSILTTVSALDTGGEVRAPSAYLLYSGKVIPAWSIRLLVLALILPVLVATVDGLARARRRGYSIGRALVWVLVAAIPFLLAFGLAIVAKLLHALSATPPGPLGAGAVPLDAAGAVVLLLILGVIVAAFFAWTPITRALGGLRRSEVASGEGPAAATLLAMCVTTVVIWVHNPVAAALVVPALHLWMWIVDPEVPLPRAGAIAFIAIGVAAPILVVAYYASTLGLGPLDVIWNGLLVVTGGHIGVAMAVEWSVLLGCLASVVAIAVRAQRLERPEEMPVTVRGPVTYAGPGSLGGTESALRARR